MVLSAGRSQPFHVTALPLKPLEARRLTSSLARAVAPLARAVAPEAGSVHVAGGSAKEFEDVFGHGGGFD